MPGHCPGDVPRLPATDQGAGRGGTNWCAAVPGPRRSVPPPDNPEPAGDRCALDPGISRLIRLRASRQDALIEVLHAVQQLHGHLSHAALRQVAQELGLPPSRVYGVASFYHLFLLQPPTAHRCGVCLGTACFVRGGGALLEVLSGLLGLAPDEQATNGRWRLERLSCVGACGQAPLLLIDDQVVADLPLSDPQALDQGLRRALAAAESAGSRADPPLRG
ncbi:MAG: NAD(P)H-dependent oxidoreductase subunit E [Synechococcaceae cyanobacterium]|nr:NAD(P)H-dependent oxidoreductase subunit E [Synechococcaceae cyanobacterium]